jgi:hypothetical protein
MAMWAGVQKVSRPMERCQEMSHWPPIMAEVTPKTAAQTYRRRRGWLHSVRGLRRDDGLSACGPAAGPDEFAELPPVRG